MTDVQSLGEVLGPLLARVPTQHQPLFIALAERTAATRYRGWASLVDERHRADFLRCAEREEDVAERVEALIRDAASIQRALRADCPELDEATRTIFEGQPLARQLAIQASGERLGAATWRAFATRASDAVARDTFLACAELEEVSAVVLESFLAAEPG